MLILLCGARQIAAQSQTSTDRELINPDRPGIADGSRVIRARAFQVETGWQEEFRQRDGLKTRMVFIPTLFRIGIHDRWEGRIESNTLTWSRQTNAGAATQVFGYSPISAGFKYQIYDSRTERRRSVGTSRARGRCPIGAVAARSASPGPGRCTR